MPDALLEFLPVVAEDADSVRARYDADANAGVDPADSAFVDTTVGGWYWDLTQSSVLEAVRLWDFLGTEMVAAMFPGTAWGDYLDLHGETLTLTREDEVQATGVVSFTGTVGTLIPAGTQVATVQPDPSATGQPVTFQTDRSITLASTPGPTNLVAVGSGTGGTLPAGSYFYMVTAIDAGGHETIASSEVFLVLSGATSSVGLSWTAVGGATAYNIYRGVTSGNELFLHQVAAPTVAYTDTGALGLTPTFPPTNTVTITAVDAGAAGNVAAGTITQVVSPISDAPAVTNASPTSGGADVESDDRYRLRIIAEYAKSSGAGTVADYVKWSLEVPQVGYVTVQPLWNGAGTVRVIITDQNNHPNSTSVVATLQNNLDPVAGQGRGQAPIGAIVTVATPSLLTVAVVAVVTHQSGYSLDGATGTIPTRTSITNAVTAYLNTLAPGQAVIRNAVIRQIMAVPGVLDVTSVTLNGTGANVAVGSLQVASAGTVSLS